MNTQRIPVAELLPLIRQLLGPTHTVRLTVTGDSMVPFLRPVVDQVELAGAGLRVRTGDIVLAQHRDGRCILHRIVKLNRNGCYLAGDAQNSREGPFAREQLIARVTAVHRGDRRIDCRSSGWRILSVLWRFMRPLRPQLIRTVRITRRYFGKVRT